MKSIAVIPGERDVKLIERHAPKLRSPGKASTRTSTRAGGRRIPRLRSLSRSVRTTSRPKPLPSISLPRQWEISTWFTKPAAPHAYRSRLSSSWASTEFSSLLECLAARRR